ncbi:MULTISPECIES: acyl-CoA thioesterase II [Actinomycetes]|uniref:acyl-CoA thioesterase n=1 Tax=Actinomycetes TaxID=1760 RepID=UPI0004BEBE5A
MTVGQSELTDLLALTEVGEFMFQGSATRYQLPRVFGGQVVGQAMMAASRTVRPGFTPHSVQCQFLRPGNPATPIRYVVGATRDGRSFVNRDVDAYQDQRRIMSARLSFHCEENGFEHQLHAPSAPAPDGLASAADLSRDMPTEWPAFYREWDSLDIRIVPHNPLTGPLASTHRGAHNQVWMRAKSELPQSDQQIHSALLSCIADLTFLSTSLIPHGIGAAHEGVQMASLDHCVWFHRPFRVDDWLLYDQVSPSTHGGLGLVRGEFFSSDGRHVATVVQEGLIRQIDGSR